MAIFIGIALAEIFSKAEARPEGFLVKTAPEVSAKNSLFLDIANWISMTEIGATIAKIIPTTAKI